MTRANRVITPETSACYHATAKRRSTMELRNWAGTNGPRQSPANFSDVNIACKHPRRLGVNTVCPPTKAPLTYRLTTQASTQQIAWLRFTNDLKTSRTLQCRLLERSSSVS